MPRKPHEVIEKEMVVIGTGMAGMAAAFFAAREGIDTAQVGTAGQLGFASGLLDLLGVHPVAEGRLWPDPWEALASLKAVEPDHPMAKLAPGRILEAVDAVLAFLASAGHPYQREGLTNQVMITPVGTTKTTFAVPRTMVPGVRALEKKPACLVVDFRGLKGFSASQIVSQLKDRWPNLRAARVDVPHMKGELYAEHLARSLESANNRRALAAAVGAHLGSETVVGMPAVLGIGRSTEVYDDLCRWLGVEIFEIPTIVPGITGLRLKEAFEGRLPEIGVQPFYHQKVNAACKRSDGSWLLTVGQEDRQQHIGAKCVVLASGRFIGNGLHADRTGIRETIFDLPVKQTEDRSRWHRKDFLHRAGHPINRCGLPTDCHFRPVRDTQEAVHANLFAAGSILADQDWIRQKCGSGLAIATAYGAVTGAKSIVLSGRQLRRDQEVAVNSINRRNSHGQLYRRT